MTEAWSGKRASSLKTLRPRAATKCALSAPPAAASERFCTFCVFLVQCDSIIVTYFLRTNLIFSLRFL